MQEVAKSSLVAESKKKLVLDPILIKINRDVGQQKIVDFDIGGNGILRYQDRLCVPDINDLREKILDEAYKSCYVIHPGSLKMYHDLKEMY